MVAGLRALLDGVVDYAGMFPPARLAPDVALGNYARFRKEPESWMLGRFVCPAARLAELAPADEELFRSGAPFRFAVIGKGGNDPGAFRAGIREDVQAVQAFRNRHEGRALVEVFEVRLPADAALPPDVGLLLREAALAPFFELPGSPDGGASLPAVLAGLRDAGGLKLRCGGLEAAAIPSPEQVARTLTACRDAGLPLKFTAGLHHPVRHRDPGLNAAVHGFLNVFAAGVLAHARGLATDRVRQIIEDEDPGSFRFDDAGLGWKDLRATTGEITEARQRAVLSFGSCSFDEPRDDLRALGLLGGSTG